MDSPLWQHALISCRLSYRSAALRGLLAFGALLMLCGYLAGSFSLRQPAVVSLDVGLTGIRGLGVLLVLFWMQETFAKEIDKKTIMLSFSYPLPRSTYVVGRFLGIVVLVAIAVLVWGGALFIVGYFSSWGYELGTRPVWGWAYGLVLLGIILDLVCIASFFLFTTSVSETSMLPFLVSAGFALAARSVGPVMGYLILSHDADPRLQAHILPVFEWCKWLLPDLSMLDWRDIVLYGRWPGMRQMLLGVSGGVGYTSVMLGAAVISYSKREFS